MVSNKVNPIQINIKIDNTFVEQLKYFNYLGSKITEDGCNKDDILSRTARVKRAFQNEKTSINHK